MQKQQDDQSYIKGTKSMQKMQEIADRLASTTPELKKYVNPDCILKTSKMISESVPVGKKGESTEAKLKKKQIQQTALMNKNEMSAQDWINKCQELQLLLDKEQDKTKQLEIELSNRQERFVHRELEYRKTIEELQMELRLKTALDQGDRKVMDQIYKDHNKIIEGINNIQLRTSKILVDSKIKSTKLRNNLKRKGQRRERMIRSTLRRRINQQVNWSGQRILLRRLIMRIIHQLGGGLILIRLISITQQDLNSISSQRLVLIILTVQTLVISISQQKDYQFNNSLFKRLLS